MQRAQCVGAFIIITLGFAGAPAPAGQPEAVRAAGAPAETREMLRERALQELMTAASSGSPQVRANALEMLVGAPSRLRAALPAAAADPNEGVRAVAAMSAGRAQLAGQSGLFVPLLEDPSPMVRAAAIYAVRRCGGDADPSPLASMLQDPSPRVRSQAAWVLGELGERSAAPMLIEAARASMPMADAAEVRLMRLQIAEARVKLGESSAIHEIRAALYPAESQELEATALAAQIIGEVRDRGSMDQLVYLTATLDPHGRLMPAEVRLAAAASLAKLGLRRGGFIADEYRQAADEALRAQAATVFGMVDEPERVKKLTEMLGDAAPRVRVAAAGGLIRALETPQ